MQGDKTLNLNSFNSSAATGIGRNKPASSLPSNGNIAQTVNNPSETFSESPARRAELTKQIIEHWKLIQNAANEMERNSHWLTNGFVWIQGKKTTAQTYSDYATRLDELIKLLNQKQISVSEARKKFLEVMKEGGFEVHESVEAETGVADNIAFVFQQIKDLSATGFQMIFSRFVGEEFSFLGSIAYSSFLDFSQQVVAIAKETGKNVNDPSVLKLATEKVMGESFVNNVRKSLQHWATARFGRALPPGLDRALASGLTCAFAEMFSQIMGAISEGKNPLTEIKPDQVILSFALGLVSGKLIHKLENKWASKEVPKEATKGNSNNSNTSTKSDTTKSDTTKSDTTKSDTTKSDTTKSDTTKSDTTKSDTTKSDANKSDTTKSDSKASDTKASDTKTADNTNNASNSQQAANSQQQANVLISGEAKNSKEILILLLEAHFDGTNGVLEELYARWKNGDLKDLTFQDIRDLIGVYMQEAGAEQIGSFRHRNHSSSRKEDTTNQVKPESNTPSSEPTQNSKTETPKSTTIGNESKPANENKSADPEVRINPATRISSSANNVVSANPLREVQGRDARIEKLTSEQQKYYQGLIDGGIPWRQALKHVESATGIKNANTMAEKSNVPPVPEAVSRMMAIDSEEIAENTASLTVGNDFSNQDMKGHDLQNTDFGTINLYRTNLDEANLKGSKFDNGVHVEASMKGANLTESTFNDAIFIGVDFTGATLPPNLSNAIFIGCNFEGVMYQRKRGGLGAAKIEPKTDNPITDSKTVQRTLEAISKHDLSKVNLDEVLTRIETYVSSRGYSKDMSFAETVLNNEVLKQKLLSHDQNRLINILKTDIQSAQNIPQEVINKRFFEVLNLKKTFDIQDLQYPITDTQTLKLTLELVKNNKLSSEALDTIFSNLETYANKHNSQDMSLTETVLNDETLKQKLLAHNQDRLIALLQVDAKSNKDSSNENLEISQRFNLLKRDLHREFVERTENSFIIGNKRPAIQKVLNTLLNEVVHQNVNKNPYLQGILKKGDFKIDIIDGTQVNAFIVPSRRNIYITTALLKKVHEVYPNSWHDALAFIVCHEIGHQISKKRREDGEIEYKIIEKDNTSEEDFADKTAIELMHIAGYNIEAVNGIFGKLFEESRDYKPLPGQDSHPHGADRDLFIRQEINKIFSRQKGEYVSTVSNKGPSQEVLAELALLNKYDFNQKDLTNHIPTNLEEALTKVHYIYESKPDLEQQFYSGESHYIDQQIAWKKSSEGKLYRADNPSVTIESLNNKIQEYENKIIHSTDGLRSYIRSDIVDKIQTFVLVKGLQSLQYKIESCYEKYRSYDDEHEKMGREALSLLKHVIEEKISKFELKGLNLEESTYLMKQTARLVNEEQFQKTNSKDENIILDLVRDDWRRVVDHSFIFLTDFKKQSVDDLFRLCDLVRSHMRVNMLSNLTIDESHSVEDWEVFLRNHTDEEIRNFFLQNPLIKNFKQLIEQSPTFWNYVKKNLEIFAEDGYQEELHFLPPSRIVEGILEATNSIQIVNLLSLIHSSEYWNKLSVQEVDLFISSLEKIKSHLNKVSSSSTGKKLSRNNDVSKLEKSIFYLFCREDAFPKYGLSIIKDIPVDSNFWREIVPLDKLGKVGQNLSLFKTNFCNFIKTQNQQELEETLKTLNNVSAKLSSAGRSSAGVAELKRIVQKQLVSNSRPTKDLIDDSYAVNSFPFKVEFNDFKDNSLTYFLRDDRKPREKIQMDFLEILTHEESLNQTLWNQGFKPFKSEEEMLTISRFKDTERKALLKNEQGRKLLLGSFDGLNQLAFLDSCINKFNISIDENFLREYAPLLSNHSVLPLSKNSDQALDITETPGMNFKNLRISDLFGSNSSVNKITNREYAYFKYFNIHMDSFKQKTTSEILHWFKENWNEQGSYRDIVLNKVFNNTRFDSLDRSTQLEIIHLYDNDLQSVKLREKYLDINLPKAANIDEKIQLITSVLSEGSKERDIRIEKAFLETGFSFSDIEKYKHLFFENSLEAIKNNRIATHGAGALLSRFLNANNDEGLTNVRKTITWLSGIRNELPTDLEDNFSSFGVKPDQLRELFQKTKPLRDGAIQEAFVGPKGFFNNKTELNLLLDDLFGESLEAETGTTKEIKDRNKLKSIVKETLYKIFDSENELKKLEIINRMMDKIIESPKLQFEDLVQVLLSSYGTVGVKLAQILASQNEIKARFPLLHSKLSDLKDSNAPIPISELMKAVETSPALKNKNVKILKLLGSASMKCVYLAEIDGEQVVLKVRRVQSDKGLDGEIKDFKYLLNQISPLLNEHFGLTNIPDYSDRIFSDIKEEADLTVESVNNKTMAKVAEEYNSLNKNSSVEVKVSIPRDDLSNGVIMVETIAQGVPLKSIREERDKLKAKEKKSIEEQNRLTSLNAELEMLEKEITRFFVFSNKFIHADPHDGNIFIHTDSSGKITISLIDLGLAQKIPALDPKLQNLLTDKSFVDTVFSINSKDLKLLSSISSFVNLTDLMNGNRVSLTVLNSYLKAPLGQQIDLFQNKLDIDFQITNAFKALQKLSVLKNKLTEHGLVAEFNELVELLGSKTIQNILDKSQGKNLKEASLILLNQLDNAVNSNFKVNQTLWRFLLFLSKSSYVIERVKDDPTIMQNIKH